jgi:hypothetical protein
MNMVVGLFNHCENAEWAIEVLEHYDVDNERISVVALDKDMIEPRLTVSANALIRGTPDANLDGLLNGSSTCPFVVSGVGPVLAIGSLAVKLFTTLGTTLAADAGGLIGALVDSGFSMEEAEIYVERVKQGGILVFVETGLLDELWIKAVLRNAGAVDMNKRRQSWQSDGYSNTADEIREAYEATYQR